MWDQWARLLTSHPKRVSTIFTRRTQYTCLLTEITIRRLSNTTTKCPWSLKAYDPSQPLLISLRLLRLQEQLQPRLEETSPIIQWRRSAEGLATLETIMTKWRTNKISYRMNRTIKWKKQRGRVMKMGESFFSISLSASTPSKLKGIQFIKEPRK